MTFRILILALALYGVIHLAGRFLDALRGASRPVEPASRRGVPTRILERCPGCDTLVDSVMLARGSRAGLCKECEATSGRSRPG